MNIKRVRSEIKIFKMWQIWPENDGTIFKYYAKVLLQYMIVTFPLLIGVMYHIYHLLTENLPFEVILVNSVIPVTSINIFYSTPLLAMCASKLPKHLDDLEDFSDFGVPPRHARNSFLMNKLVDFFRWSVRIGILFCTILGYVTQEKCKQNQIVSHPSTCGLFIDVRYPFEFQKSPFFEIFLLYQYFSLCVSYDIAVHVGCLTSVGNLELCNMLDHLNSTIYATFEDRKDVRIKLRKCVEHHIHIIRLCNQQNHTFKEIVFVLMFSLPIFIGVPAFVFLMTYDLKALVILFCWIIGLALGPYLGQQLINKSTAIAYTVYDVPWYVYDINVQRTLYLMALRSQSELKCHSSMYTLNFEAIQQTLSGAYSYITLLFTLLNKH